MSPLIIAIIFCNLLHFRGFGSYSLLFAHGRSTFYSSAAVAQRPLAPALYVFGDSLLDCGNNNFLPTLARANYPPYGDDFPGGSTGRFTNGRIVADFIADFLGLPYPPPYMASPKPTSLTGFNYASGSCGILPNTGKQIGSCLHLDDQINLFDRTIKWVLPRGLSDISNHLSKAILIFSMGNNDYINNYFDVVFSDASRRYTPPQFSRLLIDEYAKRLERLYNLGARKVVVFQLGPIGCIPSIAKNMKHRDGPCDEEKNRIIAHFNNGLGPMVKNLTSALPGSFFILGHVNWLGYDGVINPSRYGLRDTGNPCCETWLDGTSSCIPGASPCSDPNQYYFWDAYHLTEAVYSVIASRCINGSSVCIPLNIQELVRA